MKKTIVFTGGGSAGHVTPNIAVIRELSAQWDVRYIGSHEGIEKEIITKENIPYYGISSGKLRRYFDVKNFKDPFKVLKGVADAYFVLRKLKPALVFSKGGFVTVPVVIAASLLSIPVIIHESDYTPGLANKIATRFATKIAVSFKETLKYLPSDKTVHVGSPIRRELFSGDRQRGLQFLQFSGQKPVLLLMGGSLGARALNETLRQSLPQLTAKYDVVHLCGKGNVDSSLHVDGYRQFEYMNAELSDVLAATSYIISRAGANAIFEFLALKKPMVLVPLPAKQSRGDQVLNAKSFANKGYAELLDEEEMTVDTFVGAIEHIARAEDEFKLKMEQAEERNAVATLIALIEQQAR